MERYDYRTHIKEDIIQYIKDNDWFNEHNDLSEEDMTTELYDELWDVDEVTGNGAYFYDTEENCAEYLCHNINLAYESARELCMSDINALIKYYEMNSIARYFDCCIRCYLLYECVREVLYEIKNKDDL